MKTGEQRVKEKTRNRMREANQRKGLRKGTEDGSCSSKAHWRETTADNEIGQYTEQ